MKHFMITLTLLVALCAAARAEVKLHPMFGDNMVLQQGDSVPVYGTAKAGENVTVKIADRTATATADDGGDWRANIGPLTAGGPHEMTVAGENTLTIKNVLIGEVWLCSGQSNMAMQLRACENADKEAAAANLPNVRFFTFRRKSVPTPQTEVAGASWQACTPDTAKTFSAVGYFFGSELNKARNVPVGLINSSWGGTRVEAWTSLEAAQRMPYVQKEMERWAKSDAEYPAALEAYKKTYEEWQVAVKKAKAEGTKQPRRPGMPQGPDSPRRPGNLFNGMIAPLIPYGIRGAIWYQGESNANQAANYRVAFPLMITDWRTRWGRGDFPFLFVQLPDFRPAVKDPVQNGWADLREAQFLTLSLPNAGMAVALGTGMANNIHPVNKRPVGERLCLWARAKVYDEDIVYSGPLYKSFKTEGNKVRVSFDHIGGGLTAKDGELKGFAIAGKDGKFVWAKAEIDGDDVLVWNDDIAEPAAVRYAWANNPVWSLINKEGLPASPFRTDVPDAPEMK